MISDQKPTPATVTIDTTDWLKTAAIILVAIDHFGFFFVEEADWWSVVGRLAAPVFFFLIGFARTTTVPLSWIVLGVILTLLESWNADWDWVTPNILLSLALLRAVRPGVLGLLERHGWLAFTALVLGLLAVLDVTAPVVDYGASGWLWALFGLCQRMYVDSCPIPGGHQAMQARKPGLQAISRPDLMRLSACAVAATVYLWREQLEFEFSGLQLAGCIIGIGTLCAVLVMFRRGPSAIQPPQPIAMVLHFTGRHTLEIYAVQLAGSELAIKLFPGLGV